MAVSAVFTAMLLSVLGAPAVAEPKLENLCLTCTRPDPACWLVTYRWQDYNLKGDVGTTVVVTAGQPPTEDDKERARLSLLRTMPPNTTVVMAKSSRIACPPGARVE
ncbi:hypothetical protein CU669_14135 [Paramagnetospirillum kuznetsovii]|uniref:Uncharacterized protein n=1 Tax=Paramagnetospirillum kuznetsovii TaxID=2053833 RepID=A0A364NW72_9PROT|nr:hypothetical protein [Paramagnetospirillum kuznetsovii]RAU21306.1 hypothetical protein CU669_14135 [Paramagnetospirillum kuznetsovii]